MDGDNVCPCRGWGLVTANNGSFLSRTSSRTTATATSSSATTTTTTSTGTTSSKTTTSSSYSSTETMPIGASFRCMHMTQIALSNQE